MASGKDHGEYADDVGVAKQYGLLILQFSALKEFLLLPAPNEMATMDKRQNHHEDPCR